MDDRFKFRAWNNKIKKYAYFDLGQEPKWPSVTKGTITYWYSGMQCADSIEQCTGISDNNDRLIFEGDKIKATAFTNIYNEYGAITYFTVYNSYGRFCTSVNGADLSATVYDLKLSHKLEIIGTIHDGQAN